MPTLIIKHAAGKKDGQCDSRCYDAKTTHCICCCDGANHGVGLQKAIDNTREMSGELIEKTKGTDSTIQVMLPDLPKQGRDSKGRFIKKGSDS